MGFFNILLKYKARSARTILPLFETGTEILRFWTETRFAWLLPFFAQHDSVTDVFYVGLPEKYLTY